MISKFRKILSETILPLVGIGSIARRKRTAFKYLSGQGIEIGALHYPTKVRKGVSVQYVDVISYAAAIEKFPELDPEKIVKPDYIDDGFSLTTLPEARQDFIIANHVLEHSPNPLGTLKNWARVLKPNGLIYFSVPLAEKCFDHGRNITTVEHIIEDYWLIKEEKNEEFERRNREHYKEWVTISEVNMLAMRGAPSPEITETYINNRVDYFSNNQSEIHFHTFSIESINDFSEQVVKVIDNIKAIDVIESNAEVIVILQKS